MAHDEEHQVVVLEEKEQARTCEALSAFGEVTQEIATEVQKLADNAISLEECQSKVFLIIQKRVEGEISQENKQFINDHITKISEAFKHRGKKDAVKDVFYSFVSVLGKALSVVSKGFVILGAAVAVIEIPSQIINWCYSNVLKPVNSATESTQTNFAKILSGTTSVISSATGVLETVAAVTGVLVSIGFVLHTLGKGLESKHKTNSAHFELNKLSLEEKMKFKQGVIESLAEIMPKEYTRHKREIRETIQALPPEKLAKLKAGVVKAWQRFVAKKLAEKTLEQKKKDTAEMVEVSKRRLATFEETHRTGSGKSWVQKEKARRQEKSQQLGGNQI